MGFLCMTKFVVHTLQSFELHKNSLIKFLLKNVYKI